WIDEAPAVLQAWYPGERGGAAIARVLFGVDEPGGRLPITVPMHLGQCPVSYRHLPSGRGNTYEKPGQDGDVLFPFGHGLSYTEFSYENLELPKTFHGELTVRFQLSNRGAR